ncbi:hypothetical protein ACP70R_022340 [Stipagrostis hirtigluma subsp. patula]
MLTEEEIAELDEETQEVIRAIQAERRAFKPSEERIRITNLIKTDPAAAAIEIRERSLRRFEERVGPQRDYMLRQRRQLQQQEEEEAAAAARGNAGGNGRSSYEDSGGAAADRPAEQVKRRMPRLLRGETPALMEAATEKEVAPPIAPSKR